MVAFLGKSPFVRLRRRPDDPRLYITEDGSTTAAYLCEADIEVTSEADVPILCIKVTGSDPHLYDHEKPHVIRASADRILLADIHDLGRRVDPLEYTFRQFLGVIDLLRPYLSEAVPPPCGHEDVIETPELGSLAVPGICYWCPAPLVRLNDEWIPA